MEEMGKLWQEESMKMYSQPVPEPTLKAAEIIATASSSQWIRFPRRYGVNTCAAVGVAMRFLLHENAHIFVSIAGSYHETNVFFNAVLKYLSDFAPADYVVTSYQFGIYILKHGESSIIFHHNPKGRGIAVSVPKETNCLVHVGITRGFAMVDGEKNDLKSSAVPMFIIGQFDSSVVADYEWPKDVKPFWVDQE